MCGIAGWYNTDTSFSLGREVLRRMTDTLVHRGPDEDGFHYEGHLALGQRRLSIIDIAGGRQPIYNETGDIGVVYNGEIFNYVELRAELERHGHRFRTHCDTEVIVHAYEQYGDDFLSHFNGQFAIALWVASERTLILARDRVGIRPLFYAMAGQTMVFGSEMKAIFAFPGMAPEIDPAGIEQILSLWVNVPPRTPFKGVSELAPGTMMRFGPQGVTTRRFWRLTFPRAGDYEDRGLDFYSRQLRELLYDAVAIRLRADVPVGAYLSGGIDSSIISALVKKHHNNDLVTFSVAFSDSAYDERGYQESMVRHLNTDHRMVVATPEAIGESFSDVVYYSERPMIRTAPGPLFVLSRLVRSNGMKVVLTGEGADEIFGGYNIFKEDRIRRFWARHPDSRLRPLLLSRIYPYIGNKTRAFWEAFFKKGIEQTDDPWYSHRIRWSNTAQIGRLLRDDFSAQFDPTSNIEHALSQYLDPDMMSWHPLCRAQYLETVLFMSGYLLSSQGDRVMLGNSVEGRFPFLDYRMIEFAASLPPRYKLNGMNEKFILKHAFSDILPPAVVNRAKQPYRAPISSCFVGEGPPNRGRELLRPEMIASTPYWDAARTGNLMARLARTPADRIGARDDMAVAAIVSLQLLHDRVVARRWGG